MSSDKDVSWTRYVRLASFLFYKKSTMEFCKKWSETCRRMRTCRRFQKEFQKMMARRETVFSFSLHFAPFLSKLSGEKMPENCRVPPALSVERSETAQEIAADFVYYATLRPPCDNKTEVFVHFPRMITPHSFRHGSQPSVKISTIADEERIRPPAAGLRRIIPGSVGHD